MDGLDEISFLVRLEEGALHPECGRKLGDLPFQIGEGRRTVDRGLSGPQQVEIGPVDHRDPHQATWGRWSGIKLRACVSKASGRWPRSIS